RPATPARSVTSEGTATTDRQRAQFIRRFDRILLDRSPRQPPDRGEPARSTASGESPHPCGLWNATPAHSPADRAQEEPSALEGGRYGVGEGGRGAAGEVAQVFGGTGEQAAFDGPVDVGHQVGHRLRESGLEQGVPVFVGGQRVVRDLPARLLGQFGREVGEGPCRVAAQFVRLAFVALTGEDGDGRGGVVGAGGGGEAAVAGGGGDGAALQDLRDGVGVDLVV